MQNEKSSKITEFLKIFIPLMLAVIMFGACSDGASNGTADSSGGSDSKLPDAFAGRPASDLSDYDGLSEYDGEVMLVDTTVAEMDQMMRDKESFVVFFSYADCPYCNRLMPYVNEIAAETGVHVGYINTRANPEWMSNMDIDGYDIVVDRFGKYLDKDDNGRLHLYTPDMYFIKNGKVAARHEGVTPGADDASQPLTVEQEEQLRSDLVSEFTSLN